MSYDGSFFNDNFFIIDSNNYSNVSSRLYGFVLHDYTLYLNTKNTNLVFPNDAYGSYINIIKENDTIRLYQDYFGSYGLYMYKSEEYFAISNSFLFLFNYLKNKKQLDVDYQYLKAFLAMPQSSISYSDSPIKQINLLPRNVIVEISPEGEIKINKFKQREHYIDINSKEAIDLIDDWHQRWNSVIKSILSSGVDLYFDISGGKDSRMSLACCFSPNVGNENIAYSVATDKVGTHSDDYEIATQIAKVYNLNLNKKTAKGHKRDAVNSLNASMLVKCGYHKEIMPKDYWYRKPLLRLSGSGGDIRELWSQDPFEFIEKLCNNCVYKTIDCKKPLRTILENTLSEIDKDVYSKNKSRGKRVATDYFYKFGRQRNHNGKANVESFLSNMIFISPLMDPVLYKINQEINQGNDRDLLCELIYSRYMPELNNIPFDSGRTIIEKDKQMALSINATYPLLVKEPAVGRFNIMSDRVEPICQADSNTALNELKKRFQSDDCKKTIEKIFGYEPYMVAKNYYEKSYHPYIEASAIVQIDMIARDDVRGHSDLSPILYDCNGYVQNLVNCLYTARIDVKNNGSPDNKVIINTDKNELIEYPDWFKNEKGEGAVIHSCRSPSTIRIKTIGAGRLLIKLFGPWIKSKEDSLMPIIIDYCSCHITKNGTAVEENEGCCVDILHGHVMEFDCTDDDEFTLKINWKMHNYSEEQLFKLIHDLYQTSSSKLPNVQ